MPGKPHSELDSTPALQVGTGDALFLHGGYDGRTWYSFYSLRQPLPGAKEADWGSYWFTYEPPTSPVHGQSSPAPMQPETQPNQGRPASA